MFASFEANVSLLLFKIYFGPILNLLCCLALFQLFWSWMTHIKLTCIKCQIVMVTYSLVF